MMRKPDDLRTFLLASVPVLAARPELLKIYIEDGALEHRQGQPLSFRYRYTLTLEILDWPGDSATLFVPLLAWIETHQPDALADTQGLAITQDILNESATDVEVKLALSELCRVEATPGGGWRAEWLGQPSDPDRLVELDPTPTLQALFLNGTLAVASGDLMPPPPQTIQLPPRIHAPDPQVPLVPWDPGDLTLILENREL